MTHLARPLFLLILGLGCLPSFAREYEGSRANSVLLNGAWEFAVGDGTEGAESGPPGLRWQPVTLPGPFMKWNQEVANQTKFVWRLPDEEGCYWLTARTTGVAGRPVLSQRFVRAVARPTVSEDTKRRDYVVLGGNHAAQAFFRSRGLVTSPSLGTLAPGKHVVVVWDASRLSPEEKRQTKALDGFLRAGGKMVVLSTPSWDWSELCDVTIRHDPRFSRVFPYKDLKGSPLDGLDPAWLIRWNGLPGTVGLGAIEGAGMARAEKILWAREPKTTVMAVVPAASGDGRIVFAQLDLKDRLDRSKPNYDPVAERVLLNLLGLGGP